MHHPTGGIQFITYPQQQPVLAGNHGIPHAKVYQGGQAQPVFDVQPIGPMNARVQNGPNKRPKLSPLSLNFITDRLSVACWWFVGVG